LVFLPLSNQRLDPCVVERLSVVQILVNLPVVPTYVLGIPAIATSFACGKSSLGALQRYIATAHDALAQVFETVTDMPVSDLMRSPRARS
jgi:hypothetical protein